MTSTSSKTQISEYDDSYSQLILLNCGFSASFFDEVKETSYAIQRNPMRKINSASEVLSLPVKSENPKIKAYEAEDKELYQEVDDWSSLHLTEREGAIDNRKLAQFSEKQLQNLTNIIQEINSTGKKNNVVKAYKSKHKLKFYKIYEVNSQKFLENIKYKLFHKCCYPNCGRTFSSSGWLKAHFEEHLKEVKLSQFNILFDKIVNCEKFVVKRKRDD